MVPTYKNWSLSFSAIQDTLAFSSILSELCTLNVFTRAEEFMGLVFGFNGITRHIFTVQSQLPVNTLVSPNDMLMQVTGLVWPWNTWILCLVKKFCFTQVLSKEQVYTKMSLVLGSITTARSEIMLVCGVTMGGTVLLDLICSWTFSTASCMSSLEGVLENVRPLELVFLIFFWFCIIKK